MKTKTMKRLAAAVAAITMMSAVPMMGINSVFAATHNVTFKNDADNTRTYKAYQIFSGEVLDGKLAKIEWAKTNNVENVNVSNLLSALSSSTVFTSGTFTNGMTAEDVANKLKTFSDDSEAAIEFATLVRKNLNNSAGHTTVSGNSTALEEGYYLLLDTTTEKNSLSRGLLAVVGDVEIKEKVVLPTLDKKIGTDFSSGVKANTAAIDSEIDYVLEASIPDMTGYDKYYYIIEDTMSAGIDLVYDSTKSSGKGFTISVKKPDTTVINLTDKTLTEKDENGDVTDKTVYDSTGTTYYIEQYGKKFRIVFNNVKQYPAGSVITVKYKGVLNESATFAVSSSDSEANKNTAHLIYSSNPNEDHGGKPEIPGTPGNPGDPSDPGTPGIPAKPDEPPTTPNDTEDPFDDPTDEATEETPDKTVYTYTAKLVVNKTDDKSQALEGAGFTLYKLGDNGSYTSVKEINSTSGSPLSTFEFKGLDKGMYKISETQVPAGYNKASDIYLYVDNTVTINAEASSVVWKFGTDDTGENITKFTTKDSDNQYVFTVSSSQYSTTVVNQAGATLPSTGGIGTTIFYVSGGVLILGAGVVLITKKRMSLKDDK